MFLLFITDLTATNINVHLSSMLCEEKTDSIAKGQFITVILVQRIKYYSHRRKIAQMTKWSINYS